MKIVICASVDFSYEIKDYSDKLVKLGHTTEMPFTTRKIINGELTLEQFKKEKQKNGDGAFRKVKEDLIKRYYNLIKEADAILVLNFDKNNIKNYIGGNVFLEIGFAHVLDKKIFVLNNLPQINYLDELLAMQPIIINNDLNKIT